MRGPLLDHNGDDTDEGATRARLYDVAAPRPTATRHRDRAESKSRIGVGRPRPPCLVADPRRVEVRRGALLIADTEGAYRVLETASPPTFYLPPDDVRMEWLELEPGGSLCEWKGHAQYLALRANETTIEHVAWCYPRSRQYFQAIAGYVAFYPVKVECYVAGERVRPQAGDYYGGWVTDEIVGPHKGEPGTNGW